MNGSGGRDGQMYQPPAVAPALPVPHAASLSSSSAASSSSSRVLIGSVIKRNALSASLSSSVCDECGSAELQEDRRGGSLVCTNCGLQKGGQLISEESEWREFEDDGPTSHGQQSNRVGGAEDSLYFMGLSTVIGSAPDNGNAGGTSASLARLQSQATTLLDARALQTAFHRLSRLAAPLGISDGVVEVARKMYAKVEEAKLFRRRRDDSVLLACIFIACKQERVPRALKELTQAVGAEGGGAAGSAARAKEIVKAYKKIRSHPSILESSKSGNANAAATAADSTDSAASSSSSSSEPVASSLSSAAFSSGSSASASSLIERYCSTLRLPLSVEQAVRAVVEGAEREGVLEGKAPATIVGCCIFIATQLAEDDRETGRSHRRSWEQIANVTLTAVATLKRAYKLLHAQRISVVPASVANPLRITQLPPA
jgi:transcription initiation factor TFIIB